MAGINPNSKNYEIVTRALYPEVGFEYKPLTIQMFVDSKSNLIPPFHSVSVSNRDNFSGYFSDNVDEYSPSLNTASRLLQAGYNLYLTNVHEAASPLSLRIFDDGTSSFVPMSFIENPPLFQSLPIIKYADSNLAVKINLVDLEDGSYVLLEQKINGLQHNLLIYASELPPMSAWHYKDSVRVYPDDYDPMNPEDAVYRNLKCIASTLNQNFAYYTQINGTSISIGTPYGFTGISNYQGSMVPEFDPVFENYILNMSRLNQVTCDFWSTYNSDTDDLSISITMFRRDYIVTITKYSSGNTRLTETFTNTDFAALVADVNETSVLLRIQWQGEKVPFGTYNLTHIADNPVTNLSWIKGLKSFEGYLEDDEIQDFTANIIYEPIASKEAQGLMLNIFNNPNVPIIKVMTALDMPDTERDTNFGIWLDNNQYKYNGVVMEAKELYLTLFIQQGLNRTYNNIAVMTDGSGEINDEYQVLAASQANTNVASNDIPSVIQFPYPAYVNAITKNANSVSVNSVQITYNNKVFDLYHLISISLINMEIIKAGAFTEGLCYDVIHQVSTWMDETIGYRPEITLKRFTPISDREVAIEFNYGAEVSEELRLLTLSLAVR